LRVIVTCEGGREYRYPDGWKWQLILPILSDGWDDILSGVPTVNFMDRSGKRIEFLIVTTHPIIRHVALISEEYPPKNSLTT
jgi:hypothetical protein